MFKKNDFDNIKLFNQILSFNEPGSYSFSGISENLKLFLTKFYLYNNSKTIFYVCKSDEKAKQVYSSFRQFLKEDEIFYYPCEDISYSYAESYSLSKVSQRVKVIASSFKKNKKIIVTSTRAIGEKRLFFTKADIKKFSVSDVVNLNSFIELLITFGYERKDIVEGEGSFALRGGIIDIFVMGYKNPVRIEFFDDEIDSIRSFDVITQKSIKNIEFFYLIPAVEYILNNTDRKIGLSILEKNLNKDIISDDGKSEKKTLLNKLNENPNEADKYIFNILDKPLFSIIDIFNCCIFIDDFFEIKKEYEATINDIAKELDEVYITGRIFKNQLHKFFSTDELINKIKNKTNFIFWDLDAKSLPIKINKLINSHSSDFLENHNNILSFSEILKLKIRENYTTIISFETEKEKKKITALLNDNNIQYIDGIIVSSKVCIIKDSFPLAFDLIDEKLFVISYKNIFISKEKRKNKKSISKEKREAFFSDITPGDYVVHETHGIGKYLGISQMKIEGIIKDYIEIQYAKEDKLYVATDQMYLIQKYIGSTDSAPKINKLSSSEWTNTKNKTKKAVKELAKEYIKLYAKRREEAGYAFGKDTTWQSEFEDEFEFQLTDDQEKSVEEIKEDMEKPFPMDRLLCADVGFGKTEVAIRAAFKAVMDGKQVCVLVPTTILAMQHYQTFSNRFKSFPININLLSRMTPKAKQEQTIKELQLGRCEIVIGTHRLLSNDINFYDLGLLIVDEEQRFGVAHKDKLKLLKTNVDTLTLSATPIPRTLNMALTGIRDLSTLETPPLNRLEIQTFVMEYDEVIIKEAILRELKRNGQIFYLHNKVISIEECALKLKNLIPSARIATAHGQMSEKALEKTMMAFLNKEIDILICTTIIENGVDIKNANTIIVEDAQNLGLSQLYQIRGRVGRSNVSSFAYMTYPKNKSLNELSVKRLKAIKEFTKFNSGFQIAMRDLQIRGAGNILGANQSGHFAHVGYEMYCKLLSEAIAEEQGQKIKKEEDTKIDIRLNAYIPLSYIENETLRVQAYKEIASIKDEETKQIVTEDLIDRFSDLPKSVINLIDISYLRAKASRMGIVSILQNNDFIYIDYNNSTLIDYQKLNMLHKKHNVRLIPNEKYIRITFPQKINTKTISSIENIIDNLS